MSFRRGTCLLRITFALGCLASVIPSAAIASAADDRPRIIIETDAGGDLDDEQSLVRFLAYANAFWAAALQHDFATRMDWCVKEFKDANHQPVATVIGSLQRDVQPGETVKLDARASDPDGNKLTYKWWQYADADSAAATLTVANSDSLNKASFVVLHEPGKQLHIILEVADNGTPPLFPLCPLLFGMNTMRQFPYVSPVAFALMIVATNVAAADVSQWTPTDFSFKAASVSVNPFMVPFSATLKGPGGNELTLPGFYDGHDTWKVRVSPTVEGRWSLVTKSEVKALDVQRTEFTCVKNPNPNAHGVLRVNKTHPHHFIYDDGTRFFMQGYEYDWLWALDMDKPGVPTVEKSLDILAQHGFNYVILNSYAHDTKWREGNSSDDDYGPSLLYPWEGDNDHPDHSRMNLKYWQHYDQVMTALAQRGIQAHMLIKVYNKSVKWPARGSDEEKLFFRWLVARYAAYPNIIWDFSKEAHNEKDLVYKQGVLQWLRESDPYHHLTTVHDDDKANDSGAYDELTDFRADQGHNNYHALILRQRARRAWPVANVESDYEHGPGGLDDKTYHGVHTPEETIRCAWEIQMAGGYNAYYYTYTAWDVVRPLDVPPGYGFYKHFGDFWRATQYWKLEPADQLVSTGWCIAQPGREYVVFQSEAKPFTLDIAAAEKPLAAEWFNPHTGARTAAGSHDNGAANFKPPSNWGKAPLVLHLK